MQLAKRKRETGMMEWWNDGEMERRGAAAGKKAIATNCIRTSNPELMGSLNEVSELINPTNNFEY
jgi:hypothetical protein